MRLTRAIWAILTFTLVAALATTWWLTRPLPPELPWVGAVGVLQGDAGFSEPFGLAVAPDGAVYVSDAGTADRIRRIAADGRVTTVAGGQRGFADGRGADARFATPSAIALAPDGTLVVADTGNHAIRRIAADGSVTTVAGDGIAGYVDGPAGGARFNAPVGVAVDPTGRIIIADTYNDRIRVIDPDGVVRTLAGGENGGIRSPAQSRRSLGEGGSAAGYVDGPAPDARFDTPCGVAVDASGRILVADAGNGLLRAIAPDGVVSTLAARGVMLARPMALALDARGDVYVADESGQIVVLPTQGDARVLAGGAPGFADGVASDARFRRPSSLGLRPSIDDRVPQLLIADAGNAMVRVLTPTRAEAVGPWWPWGAIDLPVPPSPRPAPAFDAEAFARVPLLWPVAPLDGPHEVAGTFGEARGEAGQERFHAGLDIREVQGTLVRAVRDGIVSSPFSTFGFDTLNEGVRIGDLAYIHIRVGRTRPGSGSRVSGTGRPGSADMDLQRFAPVYDDEGLTRMRAKRGAHFATGDVVGSVNAFNHVHLNVGWPGEEHNPLTFRLVRFSDGIPPTIEPGGVRLFDEAWTPLNPDRAGPPRGRGRARRPTRRPPLEPVIVRGRVRIVVDAWDQADGNKAYRRLGLYAVGYQVLDRSGVPVRGFETPLESIRFDRMLRDSEAPRQVFATGSGIPVYGASRTQFLYVATTEYRDGVATPGFWDTTMVPPGEYVLRVFVEDFSGNRTTRDLKVAVLPAGPTVD